MPHLDIVVEAHVSRNFHSSGHEEGDDLSSAQAVRWQNCSHELGVRNQRKVHVCQQILNDWVQLRWTQSFQEYLIHAPVSDGLEEHEVVVEGKIWMVEKGSDCFVVKSKKPLTWNDILSIPYHNVQALFEQFFGMGFREHQYVENFVFLLVRRGRKLVEKILQIFYGLRVHVF